MEINMEIHKYSNIRVIAPEYEGSEEEYNYDLNTITEFLFNKINLKKRNHEE